MYHRFGEPEFPTTNVSFDQFDAHIRELTSGQYRVLPLPDVIAAFRGKEALPDRTVSITIDDAYASAYHLAWPRLRRAGFPFTLFVASGNIDGRRAGYMSWAQIRELAAAGVTIGAHTATHAHLPTLSRDGILAELNKSMRRISAELGIRPKLFAYPYGEYGLRERQIIKDAGFVAAFGQHSGVSHMGGDRFGLPRFAMNQRFGSVDRLRMAANALPIPVTGLTPADTVLRHGPNPPNFGFTVAGELGDLKNLACFASNQNGPVRLEVLGANRVEIRLEKPFTPTRGRINCTMPAGKGRWRWLGQQYYIPANQ